MAIQSLPTRIPTAVSTPIRFASSNGPDKPDDSKTDKPKSDAKQPPKPQGLGNLLGSLVSAVSVAVGSIIEKSSALLGKERFTKLAVLNEVSRKAGVMPHAQILQKLGEQVAKTVQDPKQLLDLKTVDQLIGTAEAQLKEAVEQKQGAGSFDKLYKDAEEALTGKGGK